MKVKITVLLATVLISVLFLLSPVEAASYFRVSGRGWGHGVGMSQYGAKAYAEHRWRAGRILSQFYRGTRTVRKRTQTLRVHLARGSYIRVISNSNYYVVDLSKNKTIRLPARNYIIVYKHANHYRLYNASKRKKMGCFAGPMFFKPGRSLLKLSNYNDNRKPRQIYRGRFKVVLRSGRFDVINRVNIEDYLKGVVPYEMPSSWHIEALKVQAIAARSYALYHKRNYGEYDLYSTTRSQYYGGYYGENRRSNSACSSTNTLIQTYRGRVINAVFSSSSGGKTENNENVWGGSRVAYMRGTRSSYEPSHGWRKNLSIKYVQSKLGRYSRSNRDGVRGRLRDIRVYRTGYSPRVLKLRIYGSSGISYISGNTFKSKFRLKSTWYSLSRR